MKQIAALLLSALAALPALAADADFDARANFPALLPGPGQVEALASLQREVPGVRLRWNAPYGTPATLFRPGARLSDAGSSNAVDAARGWLQQHAALFGWSSADALRTVKTLTQPDGGASLVLFHQVFGALEGGPLGGAIAVTLDAQNRVLMVRASALRDSAAPTAPTLTPMQALASVAGRSVAAPTGQRAGWVEFSSGFDGIGQYARLIAFPASANTVRAAWEVLYRPAALEGTRSLLDARTGELLFRQDNVQHAAPMGRVFRNYPGAPLGGTQELVAFAGDPLASPKGWFTLPGGVNSMTTAGNNTYVATHWAIEGVVNAAGYDKPPGPGELRPVSPSGIFDFPFQNSWENGGCDEVSVPTPLLTASLGDADFAPAALPAVVNLFYLINAMHDYWYRLGFDEPAGAMQLTNFGKGGQPGDPVIGMAQYAAVTGGIIGWRSDAWFNGLQGAPDGLPVWIAMMLAVPRPFYRVACHDLDFDASIVYHEYTHGVSNRWVGGEAGNIVGQQGGGMAEAWSDYAAMDALSAQGLLATPAMGNYLLATAQRRGMRNWSLADVPVGFGELGFGPRGSEAHSVAEVWSGALWALRTAFENRDGAAGARYATQLIADAMPISGPQPTLLDMRDAILAADFARSGSANQSLIWAVLAVRGFGLSAQTAGVDDLLPQPAFDHPDAARNGVLQGRAVDYESGAPIAGARVLVSRFESRISAAAITAADGGFELPMIAGQYPLTIQAAGYGAQPISVDVPGNGAVRSLLLRVPHNFASIASGATVVSEPALATVGIAAALDDTGATAWQLGSAQPQTATLRLGADQPVSLRRFRISPMAVPTAFADAWKSLAGFTLQASVDGTTFTTLIDSTFKTTPPYPAASELNYRGWVLKAPVSARYLRLTAKSPQEALYNAIQVGELQAFGPEALTIEPAPPIGGLHDEGLVLQPLVVVGNAPSAILMATHCTYPPLTQGVDARVTAIPAGVADGKRTITVQSALAPVPGLRANLFLTFLDGRCGFLESDLSADNVASTTLKMPAGARFLLTQLTGRVPPARVVVSVPPG